MIKLLIFALALPLLAEDVAPPTVDQLQAQLTAKNQQLAQLQERLQQTMDAYQGCAAIRAQMLQQQQRPALNPAQQRMMQQGPKPKAEDGK